MQNKDNDVLMNRVPKTIEEKLVWERSMNAELRKRLSDAEQEIGKLTSEKQELVYNMKKEPQQALQLKVSRYREQVRILNQKKKEFVKKYAEIVHKLIHRPFTKKDLELAIGLARPTKESPQYMSDTEILEALLKSKSPE